MTKNRGIRIFIGIVVAFLLFTVGSASAATITVNASGVGADYSNIQAAINNASAGDVIEVQSGTYLENVVVNKTLSLKGIGMPLVNANGSGTAIMITSGGSTVDGFNVTGSGTDWNGGDADSGIKIKSDNNSVLNSTAGFNNYGVYVFESENNTIENNNVYSNTEGIYLLYSHNNSLISNNLSSNTNRGAYISNSDYISVLNNFAQNNNYGINWYYSGNSTIFNNSATSNNYGIYLSNSGNSNLANNTAYGNTNYGFYSDGSDNIFTKNTAYINNYGFVASGLNSTLKNNIAYSNNNDGFSTSSSTLTNNTAYSNTKRGFTIASNSLLINNNAINNYDGFYINGNYNTFTNNTASDNTNYGFWVPTGNNNKFTGNIVQGNGKWGYYISGNENKIMNNIISNNSNGIVLSGDFNLIINNTITDNDGYGIWSSSSDGNFLIYNVFSNNTNHGIYMTSSKYNILANNVVSNNTNAGIYMTSSSDSTLTNNIVSNNTNTGIYLAGSNYNTLTNNVVSNNKNTGIYMTGSSDSTLTNNIVSNNTNTGIYLTGSSDSTLTNNVVSNNTNHGIYLAYYEWTTLANNVIFNNIISNNTNVGIYLVNSGGSELANNTIDNSNDGIYIDQGTTSQSSIYNNTLLNISNYSAYDVKGLNSWYSNYYDDYGGIDSNNDGIGDAAYYIAGNDVGLRDETPLMQPHKTIIPENDYNNNYSTEKTYLGASFTVKAGTAILFYEGYSLVPLQFDVSGEKVWFELRINGNRIDDEILAIGSYFSYVGSQDQLILTGRLASISQADNSMKMDSFYQFSQSLTNREILIGDTSDIPYPNPTITLSNPSSSLVSDIEGDSRLFTMNVNQVSDVTWILDGITLYTNTSVTTASYYNTSAKVGTHNLTVFAENTNGTDQNKWTWTVAAPPSLSITLLSPSSASVSDVEGDSATFIAIVNQVANVTWILDGGTLQTNTSVTIASYYNTSAKVGTHNLTVFAENANGTDLKQWTWSVDSAPTVEEPVEEPVDEPVVNTVYLRSQIINGSDITNDDMGYIGTTGNGILEINTSNFAGFYYDLNNNIGAEKFEILQNSTVSDRTINKSGLVYTTSIIDANYEQTLWTASYQKICYFGEEYVPVKSNSANKLSKILIDEKDSHAIRSGQSFELGEGYAITPQQIDVNGSKVWLELTKNGEIVADKIISVGGITTVADRTWTYKQNIGGETDVETFRIYVDQLFQGQSDSLMVIKGVWQISDSVLELDVDTTAGLMKVREIDSKIKMENNESLTLSRGSTVDIAKNISIVAADSIDVRFHLSKGYTTPGTYEIRGEAYNLSSGIYGIIDYNNFAGFYYDLNTNIGTESLVMNSISGRTIDAGSLIYTTVPKATEFEYASWGSYSVTGLMGEEYFAGYPAGTFGISSSVSLISNGQLSKVLIDRDKSYSIYTDSGLILEDGYVLNIVEVDQNGDKVYVTLTKDGSELDSSIISSGSDYIYEKNLGLSADVPLIAVHFDNIFQGTETSAVYVNGIFQISDEYITVRAGDTYGKMKVSTVDASQIKMENDNSISLTQDSTIPIIGNIKYKVADDSNNVRFYPFTEVIIESIPTESEPMSSVYDGSITEGDGYQINNYVIDVTDVFVSDNLAVFKVYDTGTLKHDEMLGINESFSFDFEGSTVQLTLRSTISGVLPRASVLIETDYNISDLHTNGIVNGGHEYAIYTGNTPSELISIGSATAALNSTVTIPVSLAYTENITGFSFDLVYNSSVATVSSVIANVNFTGASITPNIDNINGSTIVILTGSDLITVSSDTPVIDITFDVIGDLGSSTSLVLQNVEFSDGDFNPYIPDAIVNGIITVGINGDLNNNGRVDIGDVSKVAFMVAGKVPEELSVDFNDNGRVDIGDAAKIAFYLAGKVGEL